jgi:hypothetical protein
MGGTATYVGRSLLLGCCTSLRPDAVSDVLIAVLLRLVLRVVGRRDRHFVTTKKFDDHRFAKQDQQSNLLDARLCERVKAYDTTTPWKCGRAAETIELRARKYLK